MLTRLDLPIRDLLRLLATATYVGALYTFCFLFLNDRLPESTSTYIVSIAITGLCFMAPPHEWLPPWKQHWESELQSIRTTLKGLTQFSSVEEEAWGKLAYKYWLDALAPDEIRHDIHYKTGLAYAYASIYLISLASLLACSLVYALKLLYGESSFSIHLGMAVLFVFCAGALAASWRAGKSAMITVVQEGRAAMIDSVGQLTKISTVVRNMQNENYKSSSDLISRSIMKVHHAAQNIKVDPPAIVNEGLIDNPSRKTCLFTVSWQGQLLMTDYTEGWHGYGFPLQENILNPIRKDLKRLLHLDNFKIQATCSSLKENACRNFNSQMANCLKYSLSQALDRGLIDPNSKTTKLCFQYGIDRVVVRNSKVIGPSFDLAFAATKLVELDNSIRLIFDVFAGTQCVETVCKSHNRQFISQDYLFDKSYDAFANIDYQKSCDLIIVDPLYEDLPCYICSKLPKIDWKYALIQSGDHSDREWNKYIHYLLQENGFNWSVREFSDPRSLNLKHIILVALPGFVWVDRWQSSLEPSDSGHAGQKPLSADLGPEGPVVGCRCRSQHG